MARPRKLLLTTLAVLVTSVSSCVLIRQRTAKADLSAVIPQIASITLYDLDMGDAQTDETLASAISAPFSVDVFSRAASSAEHHSGPTVWKGSSLAILTLRDGSQRRAYFSYYGGFFTLEGSSGRFVVPGAGSSEFHQHYMRFIQDEFVPQRLKRTKLQAPNAP